MYTYKTTILEHKNKTQERRGRREAEGRRGQKRWREQRKEVMEWRQGGLTKSFVTKTEVNIPTTERLWPGLEWAQIWSDLVPEFKVYL
jgi:hypothetical protein